MDKNFSYFLIGIVALVIIGALVLAFSRTKPITIQTGEPSLTAQPSVDAPTIVQAAMSRGIDVKGNATDVATTFNTKTDKIVYAVLTLKNVTKNTKLSYTRSLNGKYIDSKVALPSKDGITTFYFAFEKGIGDYPKGAYTLKLYVNGKRSQTLTYVFN